MTINLPTPIDQALLNERVQEWADALVESFNERHPTSPTGYTIAVEVLRKYWRIVQADVNGTHRSVHAFLDPTTGDVYKPAGWTSPAKHVRFNLLDDESYGTMVNGIDPFGAYLYLR